MSETAWARSDRRAELPPDWASVRVPYVLQRDPVCTCPGCPKCTTEQRCERPSTEVDHLERGNDHRTRNLAGKCTPCHAYKSAKEGVTARQRPPRRNPNREQHPKRTSRTKRAGGG